MEVEAEKGSTILDVCQENGVEITGICNSIISYQAVCSGGGSCGSCHVILPKDLFDAVEPPNDLEKDLLTNVVFGVKPTSRLACRLKIDEKYAGKIVEVPMPL
ncbi:2FE-2S ferredoxin [Blastocystis sp. subtype 4]|uniref:2FE-2S ferredoxin n=1 Tax=Blastocystis sp. subtype 4 TaxID=944170 RepID=UPI0007114DF1|nr:2FE-2S ferredoxin [Blastocystis sp. subtype 4]KNB44178.1 2FE-2S ferredoxin [Blastocystis sp. subtype 4]|eukprot:XP_014527621.1 2FE-2S ferredoxin [Blastocystis sp. subtype 4]